MVDAVDESAAGFEDAVRFGERGLEVLDPLERERGERERERFVVEPVEVGDAPLDEVDVGVAFVGVLASVRELCVGDVDARDVRATLGDRESELCATTAEFDGPLARDVTEQSEVVPGWCSRTERDGDVDVALALELVRPRVPPLPRFVGHTSNRTGDSQEPPGSTCIVGTDRGHARYRSR